MSSHVLILLKVTVAGLAAAVVFTAGEALVGSGHAGSLVRFALAALVGLAFAAAIAAAKALGQATGRRSEILVLLLSCLFAAVTVAARGGVTPHWLVRVLVIWVSQIAGVLVLDGLDSVLTTRSMR